MTHISMHKKSTVFQERKGYDKIRNIKMTPPVAQVGLWEQTLLQLLRHSHPPPSPPGPWLGRGAMPRMGLAAVSCPFAGLKMVSTFPRLFSQGSVSFSRAPKQPISRATILQAALVSPHLGVLLIAHPVGRWPQQNFSLLYLDAI